VKANGDGAIDRAFRALANPTRRALVARLSRGPATVTELASRHPMSLPAFMQHLGVLESGGLVESEKRGRVRTYRLVPARLKEAEDWLGRQRRLWERRLDQLDEYLMENPEE